MGYWYIYIYIFNYLYTNFQTAELFHKSSKLRFCALVSWSWASQWSFLWNQTSNQTWGSPEDRPGLMAHVMIRPPGFAAAIDGFTMSFWSFENWECFILTVFWWRDPMSTGHPSLEKLQKMDSHWIPFVSSEHSLGEHFTSPKRVNKISWNTFNSHSGNG